MVKVNDEAEIVGYGSAGRTTITGVEMFRKQLDQGEAGDNVGCLLRGVDKEGIERGQVLAKPGSITPHTKFNGEVYVLKKEEGGRHTPFFTNYRPQFYIRTTDVTGTVNLPEDVKMVMPGDNITMRDRAASRRWLSKSRCASPSVKVAAPSVQASSPRSSSDLPAGRARRFFGSSASPPNRKQEHA